MLVVELIVAAEPMNRLLQGADIVLILPDRGLDRHPSYLEIGHDATHHLGAPVAVDWERRPVDHGADWLLAQSSQDQPLARGRFLGHVQPFLPRVEQLP